MNALKPWHVIVLLVVVLLLFGAKRLPDLAKSVGQSLKIFKSEIKDLTEDDPPKPSTPPVPLVVPPAAQAPHSAAPDPAPPYEGFSGGSWRASLRTHATQARCSRLMSSSRLARLAAAANAGSSSSDSSSNSSLTSASSASTVAPER